VSDAHECLHSGPEARAPAAAPRTCLLFT
jgi:hypothetical protein